MEFGSANIIVATNASLDSPTGCRIYIIFLLGLGHSHQFLSMGKLFEPCYETKAVMKIYLH